MMNFENGTRLAAKVDNWEQLYKVFKKKRGANLKARLRSSDSLCAWSCND